MKSVIHLYDLFTVLNV